MQGPSSPVRKGETECKSKRNRKRRERERERERGREGGGRAETWRNLLPWLIALTRGCVIAGSLDLLKKYYQGRAHSSKLLGTQQISSLGFGCLTRATLSTAS